MYTFYRTHDIIFGPRGCLQSADWLTLSQVLPSKVQRGCHFRSESSRSSSFLLWLLKHEQVGQVFHFVDLHSVSFLLITVHSEVHAVLMKWRISLKYLSKLFL